MSSQQDNLDELLRQWADFHEPSEIELRDLSRRIAAAARTQVAPCVPQKPRWLPSMSRRQNAVWFALGVAVVLLVTVAIWWDPPGDRNVVSPTRSPEPQPQRPANEPPPEVAWLAQPQLKDKQVLLEEMERLFAGRVAWIAETRDQVRIGLAPDGGAPTPNARRLAVRLVVTRRTANSVRQPVWTVDVISHHEQLVHLSGPAGAGAELTLWTYTLPDGMIAIDSRLDLDGDTVRLDKGYCGLQQAGIPKTIDTWNAQGAEYEVYQTVAPVGQEGRAES